MDWCQKLDELNRMGFDVTDRIVFPDHSCGGAYPEHWTTEQMVNEAYAYVANLKRDCPNLTIWNTQTATA